MLWTICIVLLVLWLLGAVAFPIGSGLVHILLILAVIFFIFQVAPRSRFWDRRGPGGPV